MDETLVETKQVKLLDLPLDAKDPMSIARIIVTRNFTKDGLSTLWRYRGTFWKWIGSYYQMIEDETLRAHVWEFLDKGKRQTDKGAIVAFKPTRAIVNEVIDAMTAV